MASKRKKEKATLPAPGYLAPAAKEKKRESRAPQISILPLPILDRDFRFRLVYRHAVKNFGHLELPYALFTSLTVAPENIILIPKTLKNDKFFFFRIFLIWL